MQIGVVSGFDGRTPPELVAAAGQAADARGLHSFFVPEHVLFFEAYASRYPYSEDGRLPGDPTGVLEPFAALGWIAAHTERIRLGTGICLVPQRSPVYTAKQVADLDFLSGGRVEFGVGIGWLREEFEALGVPFEDRAARTRECIEVMKTLWCDEVSEHRGERFTLPPCLQNPKPVQKPHPPIFFGGESDAAFRRVARLGQGWYGFQVTPEALPVHLKRLDGELAAAGRSRGDVRVYVLPAVKPDRDAIAPYADAGVDQLLLPLYARDRDGFERRTDAFAALVG